jgi:putative transposase
VIGFVNFLSCLIFYLTIYMFSKELCQSAINYYRLHTELSSKKRIDNINTIFGISRASFFRIFKKHAKPIEFSSKNNSKRDNKNRKCKYNKKILNFIKRYVCKIKTINATHLISLLKNIYNIKISRSYLYALLKKLGVTHKKVYIKKQPFSIKEYITIKNNFYEKIDAIGEDKIISIDETAVYLNSKNDYGWALKGCKCIIREKNKRIYQKKFSLLMAISNKKIISYGIYEKSVNGKQYLHFIKNIIEEYKNEYTLLMDNATIHKTKMIKAYAESESINILYNIPYNPETNPIEMIFCPIKNYIKSHNTNIVSAIETSINEYIENINEKTLQKMFNKSFSH